MVPPSAHSRSKFDIESNGLGLACQISNPQGLKSCLCIGFIYFFNIQCVLVCIDHVLLASGQWISLLYESESLYFKDLNFCKIVNLTKL